MFPQLPRSVVLVSLLAALAISCSRAPEESTSITVSENPFATPVESARFQPEFPVEESAIADAPVADSAPRTVSYPDLRIDIASPDVFLRSLQAMERVRPADDMDVLKRSLEVIQLDAQQRIYQMAARENVPPQFTDQQLMQIVYAGIDGMTLEQVVAHAGAIAARQ